MDTNRIFITKFDTTADFNAAKNSLSKPHVSLTDDDGKLHYMKELSVTVTINITQTSSATPICNNTQNVTNIIIDGEDIGSVVGKYTFSTTGSHTIKYLLSSDTIKDSMFNSENIIIQGFDEPDYPAIPITNAVISDGIKTIEPSAFYMCETLTSVTIGNDVEIIGDYAFESCVNLAELTIPKNISYIHTEAFDSCINLDFIEILNSTPPTLETLVFSSTGNCPIYVPDESVNTYKSATNWSTYASRIYPLSDNVYTEWGD